jgi:hypothetical protein
MQPDNSELFKSARISFGQVKHDVQILYFYPMETDCVVPLVPLVTLANCTHQINIGSVRNYSKWKILEYLKYQVETIIIITHFSKLMYTSLKFKLQSKAS